MTDRSDVADEKWDDSALLDDWNQAYQEYKKYHSLAIKGVKVDEADVQAIRAGQSSSSGHEEAAEVVAEQHDAASRAAASAADAPTRPPVPAAGLSLPHGLPDLGEHVLNGSISPEDLKNAMMAWYYAGYYTGLYDGQQKAYARMQEEK